MAPPLKDGIWLTITPHKAVVETLSTLGLTPHLHRHDEKRNKTHKFVGFEPMRLDFKSNSLSKSELQLRVF